jgi:hypothetical protein
MPSRGPIRRFNDMPLRGKLILSFLAVILIGGVLSLVVGTRLEHRTIVSLAEDKVRHDLASAWMVYDEKLNTIRDVVRLCVDQNVIRSALLSGRFDAAADRLEKIRREFGLDVLTLTDGHGLTVFRARPSGALGDDRRPSGPRTTRRAE